MRSNATQIKVFKSDFLPYQFCQKNHVDKMAATIDLRTLVNFLCLLPITFPEKLGGSLPDFEFDFDALPGTQHEFKIVVKAGKEECFVQKVAQGANLHIQFEVIRIRQIFFKNYDKP